MRTANWMPPPTGRRERTWPRCRPGRPWVPFVPGAEQRRDGRRHGRHHGHEAERLDRKPAPEAREPEGGAAEQGILAGRAQAARSRWSSSRSPRRRTGHRATPGRDRPGAGIRADRAGTSAARTRAHGRVRINGRSVSAGAGSEGVFAASLCAGPGARSQGSAVVDGASRSGRYRALASKARSEDAASHPTEPGHAEQPVYGCQFTHPQRAT